GSHAGVSIGEDGPSQMGLEDLAAMRAIFGSTVVYPCDANQTAKLLAVLADQPGVTYIRTTRQATPVIYDGDEDFELGGSRVLRSSSADALTIVTAGVTVPEALAAADSLAEGGTAARVIDLYSIKPLDLATLSAAASETGHVLTVEDHWPEGGIGEAVFSALATAGIGVKGELLAVRHMPGSATPEQELAEAGIDRAAIVAGAKRLIGA
ncbi:MAG: transketolase, partial [Chloroflexota bacterium]|nr:transketolase [Chloroflexota bacterium]